MNLPDREDFNFKDCVIAGDECWLITPKDMSVKWIDEIARFRSCIVRKSDNFVVSQAFKKFTNFGERPDFQPWDSSWKFEARHKLDGCCDQDTVLITENGEMTIKDICESKYSGKVLGFNHDTNSEELVDILAHSIKSNNNDWYELELENNSIIRLTGNHKVYLPELNCYRKVSDLKGGEVFLLSKS